MTQPGRDDVGHGTPGRAKKRTKDLLRDAWGVREAENGWLIRAPMDDWWQRWEPVDKEWSVMVEWRVTEKP